MFMSPLRLRQTLAILPLRDDRSSIVWSPPPESAAELMALSEAGFCLAIERATDAVLGRVVRFFYGRGTRD